MVVGSCSVAAAGEEGSPEILEGVARSVGGCEVVVECGLVVHQTAEEGMGSLQAVEGSVVHSFVVQSLERFGEEVGILCAWSIRVGIYLAF